jgi:hypothetical protein
LGGPDIPRPSEVFFNKSDSRISDLLDGGKKLNVSKNFAKAKRCLSRKRDYMVACARLVRYAPGEIIVSYKNEDLSI